MTTDTTDMPQKIHEGRNVRRFREMLGLKQDALAYELGEDWTQKKISQLEQKETIDASILEQIAKALKVPVDAIRNFSEEQAIYNIQNNYEGSNASATNVGNYHCTFNPIEKLVELYERLLASEREKIEILQGRKS